MTAAIERVLGGVRVVARSYVPNAEPAAYEAELELRYRVLREPLGMTRADVPFAAEFTWAHFIAETEAEGVIGCVLSSREGEHLVQLRQMAVRTDLRTGGIGRLLVDALEQHARGTGARRVTMHAREVAVGFYAKLGYAIVGDRFTEVGIPHFVMEKDL
ncbi:MAG: GNAT family N-acetyltransferase [Polyangiaceae bacterium]